VSYRVCDMKPLDSRIASGVEQLCGNWGMSSETGSHAIGDDPFVHPAVLHANTAITHLRQLIGFNFAPSSYCEARQRLPLVLLQSLLQMMPGWVDAILAGPLLLEAGCWGRRVECQHARRAWNARSFPAAAWAKKPGVGYPMAKIMGLMDAATGMFLQLLELPLFQHDMRGVMSVHRYLRAGDILLGDRALCSFAHLPCSAPPGCLVAFACTTGGRIFARCAAMDQAADVSSVDDCRAVRAIAQVDRGATGTVRRRLSWLSDA